MTLEIESQGQSGVRGFNFAVVSFNRVCHPNRGTGRHDDGLELYSLLFRLNGAALLHPWPGRVLTSGGKTRDASCYEAHSGARCTARESRSRAIVYYGAVRTRMLVV